MQPQNHANVRVRYVTNGRDVAAVTMPRTLCVRPPSLKLRRAATILAESRGAVSFKRIVRPPLSRAPQQLLGSETDILGDLSEECWRDVASLVKGNRCRATIGMPELFVGTALTDFAKA